MIASWAMKWLNKNLVKRKIFKRLPERLKRKIVPVFLPTLKTDIDHICFRMANTPEDYLSAFNLVYKVFIKVGYAKPSRTPFRLAPQHCNHDSRVFIGELDNQEEKNKIVFSISIFPDSENGLPMDMSFKKDLDRLRDEGRSLVEAGHLAADPSHKLYNMSVPMLGNKILYHYAAEYLRADDIVIAVHPKHKWFYEHILMFSKLSEIKGYSYANNNPAVAMRLDLKTAKDRYFNRYQNVKLSKNLYHYFIVQKPKAIHLPQSHNKLDPTLLDRLKTFYGMHI